MDTNLVGPREVPDKLMEIASKPGRLIKGNNDIWRPPSRHPTGGRVMMESNQWAGHPGAGP